MPSSFLARTWHALILPANNPPLRHMTERASFWTQLWVAFTHPNVVLAHSAGVRSSNETPQGGSAPGKARPPVLPFNMRNVGIPGAGRAEPAPTGFKPFRGAAPAMRGKAGGNEPRHQQELLYRALLADQTRVLGADHPDTLQTREGLAEVLTELGRLEEAESLYQALLADQTRVLGADHPDTLQTRDSLADLRLQLGPWGDEPEGPAPPIIDG